MKYSYQWLQSHIVEPLPSPSAVADTIVAHAFEVESVEPVGDDTVFDISVLPDRAGDCLSHVGMARELAGLLQLTMKPSSFPPVPPTTETVPLEVTSDQCRVYTAVRIEGVRVGPSPAWLVTALESIGQRSINNIVDATNYILFDLGQPTHCFDAAAIDGGIVVRAAHEGETIKLLGGEEKTLTATDTVIADFLGAIAIAGVKGGATAEVNATTTTILIEVANFDPIAVRKTARRLGLMTDASKRFENGISPQLVAPATAQLVALVQKVAGGTVTAQSVVGTDASEPRTVSFAASAVTKLLGGAVTADDIATVFDRYGYRYERTDDDRYTLTVPSWRADITGPHDVAEEVGRVRGYDHIPAAPLPFLPTVEQNETELQATAVRAWAIAHGYREVYTYTFRGRGEVAIAYGAKGRDHLRATLSDGLQESYELNRLNAPLLGINDLKLFEIGTVFSKDTEDIHVAICDTGSIQELPLAAFIEQYAIDTTAPLDTAGVLVDPHPFHPWSQYPFITRDLAVWVSNDADRARLESMIDTFGKAHCVRVPYLFDTFSKEGRTSLAYRMVFQSFDKTLTDEEVSRVFQTLTDAITADPAFEMR